MNAARKCLLAAAMMLAAARTAAAADTGPPFYAAFQKFCVATNARLDAIGAAVAAARGKARQPASTVRRGSKQLKIAFWDFQDSHGPMQIMAVWGTQFATGQQPQFSTDTCSITAVTRDDVRASANAIQKWLGVPPYNVTRSIDTTSYFAFRDDGHERSGMLSDQTAWARIVAQGQAWSMTLTQGQDIIAVTLQHRWASTASSRQDTP